MLNCSTRTAPPHLPPGQVEHHLDGTGQGKPSTVSLPLRVSRPLNIQPPLERTYDPSSPPSCIAPAMRFQRNFVKVIAVSLVSLVSLVPCWVLAQSVSLFHLAVVLFNPISWHRCHSGNANAFYPQIFLWSGSKSGQGS